MQVTSAKVLGLHGIFDHKVKFFSDYTFIHGINGTGKTSLLRAIQALTFPEIDWLCLNSFRSIEVSLEHESRKYTFRCEKHELKLLLKMRVGNVRTIEEYSTERIDVIIKDRNSTISNLSEKKSFLHQTIELMFSPSIILKEIRGLPTPIVLGLNRTSNYDDIADRFIKERRARLLHPTVSAEENPLDQGLTQAGDLIRRISRQINIKRQALEADLRKQITLLMFSQGDRSDDVIAEIPTLKDITNYRKMKVEIIATLRRIGYTDSIQSANVSSFFERIIANAKLLIGYSSISDVFEKLKDQPERMGKVFRWFDSRPIIELAHRYFETIEDFNKKDKNLRKDIERYEQIINSFFLESRKTISINQVGEAQIKLKEKNVDVLNLSSGEKQIFVLISHLMFNPVLKRANVLIIDEPELSLHVRWQELFVESIRKANPKTQMILATHSPSIVLDRTDKMVSLDVA